jgi:hypothetical protein
MPRWRTDDAPLISSAHHLRSTVRELIGLLDPEYHWKNHLGTGETARDRAPITSWKHGLELHGAKQQVRSAAGPQAYLDKMSSLVTK